MFTKMNFFCWLAIRLWICSNFLFACAQNKTSNKRVRQEALAESTAGGPLRLPVETIKPAAKIFIDTAVKVRMHDAMECTFFVIIATDVWFQRLFSIKSKHLFFSLQTFGRDATKAYVSLYNMDEYMTCNGEPLDTSKHATEATHAYTKCFIYLHRGNRSVYLILINSTPEAL